MGEGKVVSHNMSISHPIPGIRLFQNLTFKIQCQGHGRGQSWKSQSGCNIISIHPFHSMSISPPIPEIQHFQNLTLIIRGLGHGWGGHWRSRHGSNILSTHIPLIPCQSAIPFLRWLKIWPWKFKLKVMGEGNVESHKVGVTSYRLTSLSLHVNRPFHSWDTAFSKFDHENSRSRSNDHDVAQLQV